MMTTFFDDAHRLALAVAPELEARPLYLLDAERLREAGIWSESCFGIALAGGVIPAIVSRVIGEAWRGPGPVVGLDLAAIEAQAIPGRFEGAARAVLAHELAHLLPPSPIFAPTDDPALAPVLDLAFSRGIERIGSEPPPPPAHDRHHDLAFYRRLIHLHHRAEAAGWPFHLRDAFASGPGALRWARYAEILAPEAEAMRGRTFAEIEATAPPRALAIAWNEDRLYFHNLSRNK